MVFAMISSFITKFHSQLTVVGVTRGVRLGYIHNTMAKYKLPYCMAVFPLHIEPTAYDTTMPAADLSCCGNKCSSWVK